MNAHAKTRIVGSSVPRKEGVDKLLGRARYVDDLEREGLWHGLTVRSTIPRGLIRSIQFDPKIDWAEFAIVTAADIPGDNHIQLIFADQPCLADGKVNHCDEAVVLLAHPDKCKVREAAAAVTIEYQPLPPVFTIEESEKQETIIWGADNLFKSFLLEKGDVDSTWARSDTYRRRRIPHRGTGTSLHRKQRLHRRVRRPNRPDRLGFAAVPLLRA